MTGRQRLNRRKWRLRAAELGGLALLSAGAVIGLQRGVRVEPMVFVPGLLVYLTAVLAERWGAFRCPRCHANLHFVLHDGVWLIDPKHRYCPFCRGGLDDPVE